MNSWEPSAAYKDYCRTTKQASEPERAPAPFDPCLRFRRIPDGCAVCVYSLVYSPLDPCPDHRDMYLSAITEATE